MISGRTDVLAILGDPITQARTPELVNAELARRGLDAVLVPLHVTAADLAGAVTGLRRMGNVRGAVVTMPHKQAVVGLVDDLSPTAREVGACNVIRFGADRAVRGDLTDGHALVTALTAVGAAPRGARVFLAGAGGAAAAIAFALAEEGAAALTVHNRTRARAEPLANAVHKGHPGTTVEVCGPDGRADIVVNATPVGIDPARRELPFDLATVAAGAVMADIVISPRPTALVTFARAERMTVVDGEDMLRAQVGAFVDVMLGDPAFTFNSCRPQGREGGPRHA
jgi:shikimate dehydrogenase